MTRLNNQMQSDTLYNPEIQTPIIILSLMSNINKGMIIVQVSRSNKKMCQNNSNSVSIAMLSIPLIFFASTLLNIRFLISHWTSFQDLDLEILRAIAIFLMVFGFNLNVFTAFIFTQKLIRKVSVRLLYILLCAFGLGQAYLYMYQKSDKLGLRLKSIQYKLSIVNFTVDLSNFLFNYSMLFLIYLPFYKQLQNPFPIDNIDKLTIIISSLVIFTSCIIIILKGVCLMCFQEQDDNWFKRLFFMGICCCDWLECVQTRKYYVGGFDQSQTTDYS